jgi:ComF family protein
MTRSAKRRWTRWLADAVLPPRCLGCNQVGTPLCDACERDLPRLPEPSCPICASVVGLPTVCDDCAAARPVFDRVTAGLHYRGPVRRALLQLKFGQRQDLARGLGLAAAMAARRAGLAADLVVPVPLHHASQKTRGYNQAALIAREVAYQLDLPLRTVLERHRDAPRQARARDADERRRNVAEAFRARTRLDGLAVLLVDDICTTGATLDACAAALKKAGAARVEALVAARTESNVHRPDD